MMEIFDSDNYLADIIYRVQNIYNDTDDGLSKLEVRLVNEYAANVVVS